MGFSLGGDGRTHPASKARARPRNLAIARARSALAAASVHASGCHAYAARVPLRGRARGGGAERGAIC